MKRKTWSPLKIVLVAIIFGLLFWIADSLIHYFEFSSHLKMMIAERPGNFADTLILHVYPHQLIVRLTFLVACLIAGLIIIIFLSRQQVIEKELIESEEQYRNVTERANDGIGIIYNGKFEYVNPRLCEIGGYTYDEVIGTYFMQYLVESDKQKVINYYEKRIKHEDVPPVYETTLKHKNGSEVFVEINAGLIKWKEGEGDLILVRDISFRKLAEKALKQNEEKYRTLLNNIHAGLYRISSEKGAFIEVNSAFVSMFGYTDREDVLNHNVVDLFANEKEGEQFNIELMTKGVVANKEILLKRKDGQTFWAKASAMLIKDDEGNPVYYDGLVEDITEKKQAEELLKKTNRELRQLKENLEIKVKKTVDELRNKDHLLIKQSRHASMGEMIGNIAHQWRQPLTAIAVLVQDIEEAYNYDELTPEYLSKSIKTTMDQLTYMSRTIDDFRNFFKPNKLKEDFSANEVLLKTIDFIQKSFENDQIELVLDLKEECSISGYPNEYSQVILNILNNAKDAFVENNTKNPHVEISLYKKGNRTILSITDNAGSISEDIIDRVFDPYFTTKQNQKGTGLGLYMAKTIIERNMEGAIYVHNIDGGVRFMIEV